MRYHLSYNEATGKFRIDETGATILTDDTNDYMLLLSADGLDLLIIISSLILEVNRYRGVKHYVSMEELRQFISKKNEYAIPELLVNVGD